jgi:hypothetical protein
MSDEKQFVDGLIIKPPRQGAPDFVKGSISIKRAELGNWLRSKSDEWINLDIKESKKGTWYAEVNTWKPQGSEPQPEAKYSKPQPEAPDAVAQSKDDFSDDIPF